MAKTYYSVLTQYGTQLITSAIAQKQPLQLLKMAIGDGNGQAITPEPSATRLARQVYSNNVSAVSVDPRNNKQVIFELTIPETEGGFWIREIGLLDNQNRLVAYANCPESFKPALSSGSGKVQVIRLILAVSSSDAFELTVDNRVIFATKGQLTPKTIDATTNNAIDDAGHSHAIAQASTSEKGIVRLTNDTGLDSENLGLTAKAGKALSQQIAQNQQSIAGLNSSKVDKTTISNSVSSTSQTNVASSLAVKTAHDKAVEAKELAESKQSPATTLAGYGITDFKIEQSTGDANDFKTDGNYYFASGQNLPDTDSWHIEVVSGGQANAVRQIARKASDTKIKTRFFNGTSWTSWKDTGGDGVPLGAVVAFPKEIANPQGFLLANGSTFSQQTYPDLYRTLGNKNTLPNLQRSDVGQLAYFPTENIPAGWLPCNHSTGVAHGIRRADYPDLFDYLNGKYGRFTKNRETYYYLPHAEDRFIRSVGAGLTVGQKQEDEVKAHTHKLMSYHKNNSDNTAIYGAGYEFEAQTNLSIVDAWGDGTLSDNGWIKPTINSKYATGGSETRPKSIAFILCIKARNNLDEVKFWIKAFGSIENEGQMNAAHLAQDIQDIKASTERHNTKLEQHDAKLEQHDAKLEQHDAKLEQLKGLKKNRKVKVIWRGNLTAGMESRITLSESMLNKRLILFLQMSSSHTLADTQRVCVASVFVDEHLVNIGSSGKYKGISTGVYNGSSWRAIDLEYLGETSLRLRESGGMYLKQISAI